MSPYLLRRPLDEPGWLGRLFGREPKRNGFTKVWNPVATTPIVDILPQHAEVTSKAYHGRLAGALKDRDFTEDEKSRMAALSARLRLSADVAMAALKSEGCGGWI